MGERHVTSPNVRQVLIDWALFLSIVKICYDTSTYFLIKLTNMPYSLIFQLLGGEQYRVIITTNFL